jgi:hypothetical protein
VAITVFTFINGYREHAQELKGVTKAEKAKSSLRWVVTSVGERNPVGGYAAFNVGA